MGSPLFTLPRAGWRAKISPQRTFLYDCAIRQIKAYAAMAKTGYLRPLICGAGHFHSWCSSDRASVVAASLQARTHHGEMIHFSFTES
jgi:hypothetical protein